MDSKFTKVTPQKFTGKPFKKKVQPCITEKPLVASKNSFDQGLQTELQVLEDLRKKSCTILGHRVRTPFAEVDILFLSSKGQIVLLEVKSLSKWAWIETRLTQKQLNRIKRAAFYLEAQFGQSVQICAAFVIDQKIFYLEID